MNVFCACPSKLPMARQLERTRRKREHIRASILRPLRQPVVLLRDRFVEPQARHATLVVGPEITCEVLANREAKVRLSA